MTMAPTIRIAAALIEDGDRTLLVRKAGTRWFMQAGGKIEPGESAVAALCRELREEIGLVLPEGAAQPLGRFTAAAANESGYLVEAEIFHLSLIHDPAPGAEIAETLWLTQQEALALPLAPLTRDAVLPLWRSLSGAK
jgi:8-oxo-dGTP diphosphatase